MAATEEREAVGAPASGLALGRYRLGRRLGAGGFGTVYAAHDERLDRPVAVKVIPADGPAPERAQREAHAAARLDHPGIVAVHDAGEDEHCRYLVSELVKGRTLAKLEADGALSDRDVLRIGLALADALAHAHERGVVHRDVKPQNVIVPRGNGGGAKLADFGVAHLAGADALTHTGDVVGTLAYMAPEQAAGGAVDERTDLYALGLVLYEALTGLNPIAGATPAATARLVGSRVPGLLRRRRDLPPALCAAIDRTLKPRPDDRGTLADLAQALADALTLVTDDGGVIAPHPLEGARVPPAAWRLLAGAAAGFLAVAALAGLSSGPLLAPGLAGAAVALAVAALPRVGWMLGAVVVVAGLMLGADPEPGAATLIVAAVLVVPAALPAEGMRWSVPALAPALGLLGLAGAYPALAARAPRALTRAALGALGAWWLLLAEALLARALLLGPPAGLPPRAAAESGAGVAAGDVLAPLATTGGLALCAVWAAAAVVAPWLVRGRSVALAGAAAAGWTLALAGATAALGGALGDAVTHPEPRGLAAGAVLAGVLAVAWRPGAGPGPAEPE